MREATDNFLREWSIHAYYVHTYTVKLFIDYCMNVIVLCSIAYSKKTCKNLNEIMKRLWETLIYFIPISTPSSFHDVYEEMYTPTCSIGLNLTLWWTWTRNLTWFFLKNWWLTRKYRFVSFVLSYQEFYTGKYIIPKT